ncbi:MAG: hypothetical protein NTZ05_05215 [Chloroflexi bacterium]|nr:hypothetical protein [Chloroflexota bacterium]
MKLKAVASKLREGYGAVQPSRQPEDWAEVRAEIEQAIAEEVVAEG